MKKTLLIFTVFLFIISCKKQRDNEIIIASASNMQFVMKDLVKKFNNETNVKANLIIGSSGKICTQIILGAPYDIFISANEKYARKIIEMKTNNFSSATIALGKLIVVAKDSLQFSMKQYLTSSNINQIAIANPLISPYGQATKQVLKKWNIWEVIKPKLVFGESIAQTNQFINLNTVDIGFTAKSFLFSDNVNVNKKKYIEIPSNLYAPLKHQLLVVSTDNRKKKLAKEFTDFMSTAKAKESLLKYGYDIP